MVRWEGLEEVGWVYFLRMPLETNTLDEGHLFFRCRLLGVVAEPQGSLQWGVL
jgi:hypothetical protein